MYFFKDIWMTTKPMKQCSASLIFRKMQIKSKEIPHYCQNGKQKDNKHQLLVKRWRKRNSHAPLAACKHNGNQYEASSKFKNELLHSPATPLLSIYLKETKSPIQKYIHTLKFTAVLFIMAKLCMPKDLMI